MALRIAFSMNVRTFAIGIMRMNGAKSSGFKSSITPNPTAPASGTASFWRTSANVRPWRSANGMNKRMVAISPIKPVMRSTARTVVHSTGFREMRIVS